MRGARSIARQHRDEVITARLNAIYGRGGDDSTLCWASRVQRTFALLVDARGQLHGRAPGGTTAAGAITFNPATTLDAAGARSTLTLNPLADGGGADSAITLG